MKSFAIAAAFAGAVMAAPQAVTSAISPEATAPSGCKASYDGTFQLVVEAVSGANKRDIAKRDALEVTLSGGIMTDAKGRTGYIASNDQFQFDGPAQAGAIYTAGWSVCSNGSIALGGSTVFYQCLSGSFYNLYDTNTAAQCSPVHLVALGSSTQAVSVSSDGQVTAPKATATVLCQIGDGQIQQNTCVTTATAIQQQSDGQITAAKATITQIADGQIQAPTSVGAVITQITDGQIQAPTTTAAIGAVVSVASDGQPVASGNGTTLAATSRVPTATASATGSSSPVAQSTGGAAALAVSSGLLALVGAVALFAL